MPTARRRSPSVDVTRLLVLCVGLGLAIAPARVPATPHLPASDDVVVETLPIRYDPSLSGLALLHQHALRHASDPASVLPLARAYIEAARRNGDPRFLGYAQSSLAAWPEGASAPLDVRVLRATIRQSLHQFTAALIELDEVLAVQRDHAQALITRATILQVLGRYSEAQRDCAALWRSAGEVTTSLCLASVASVTGKLSTAGALAQRALLNSPVGDVADRLWATTLMAEISVHRGDYARAAEYFQAALQLDANDRYARGAYCDLLLDRGQLQQVLELTSNQTRDDNLLLRRALTLQAFVNATSAGEALTSWQRQRDAALAQLRERHAAARLRGDRTHLREAARMALFLEGDPRTALQLARENWNIQKEPADARILLEAATAMHDSVTRTQLATWLQRSGLIDLRLAALLHS